jgi:hypothetical protein
MPAAADRNAHGTTPNLAFVWETSKPCVSSQGSDAVASSVSYSSSESAALVSRLPLRFACRSRQRLPTAFTKAVLASMRERLVLAVLHTSPRTVGVNDNQMV